LQGIVSRNNGHSLSGRMIKQLKTNHFAPLCAANEDLALLPTAPIKIARDARRALAELYRDITGEWSATREAKP